MINEEFRPEEVDLLSPRACANSNKEHRCPNKAEDYHVFCENCRMAYGGYPFARRRG
jgi:hypothetical protein